MNLPAKEVLAATPSNWHPDGWSLGLFEPTWQYAPILLIDGPTGVLPSGYLTAFDAKGTTAVPLVIGATRQESDFAPGDDVRNFTRAALRELVLTAISKSTTHEIAS